MNESLNSFEMKFDIATNFDPDFIERISKYNLISEVYGKLNNDLIGGGRPSIVLPKLSWHSVENHINLCHKNNIKFNYLMNALCLGNQEFQKNFHRKIIQLLEKLSNLKVDSITVASPYLCELIKTQFPHLKVSISVYNRVRTLQQIKYWEELGADEITLFHSVNRDFNTIKKFLTHTKLSGLKLRLIGNNSCLHECPFHSNHAVGHSHASRKGDLSSKFHIDYHILSCNNLKIKHPSKLISSEWIRPEDVHYYEEACLDAGNTNLSIKLTDRSRTTDFLVRVVKAYKERNYEGNLLDIIHFVGNKDHRQVHKLPMYIEAILGLYNIKRLIKIKDTTFPPLLFIDNKKLDGFLEKFINRYDCYDYICDDMGWINARESNEEPIEKKCSYCKNWAKKAISVKEEDRLNWVDKSDSFLMDLKKSKIFHFFNSKRS